ncbi:hypothetical protein ACFQ61_08175 [Streptomyces sp. NPDC056500]|uniref:hypothetical protein n=1 Tax=Streptomyces sp. NPDC056500 TaxID=3345840 RepID=UPI003684848B
MPDLTPVPTAGPQGVAAPSSLLVGTTDDVDHVLRMGWEATPDGLVIPVALVTVRHAK